MTANALHNSRRRSVLLAIILLSLTCAALAQAPSISKVEPPNWWVNMPQQPMVMLTGQGLAGAKLATDYPGLRISRVEPRPDGRYLFAWLEIGAGAKPGAAKFTVTTERGTTSFTFPVEARASQRGRYQGITPNDVIYLIMPDRFADGDTANDNPPDAPGETDRSQPRKWHGGDLKGVTEHIPYLKKLGVTAIWLTPWWKQATTTSDYHGYGCVDFYATDEHLGTMKDLDAMVTAAHRAGIKVIMDYVVNHTGPLHPWAQHPPTPTWINGTPEHHTAADYDFATLVDPHATRREYRNVLDGWFANILPDLHVEDPLLAEYLADNAIWWMESTGFDAFRLDTFPYSPRSFWAGWHRRLFRVYPHTWTVGEVMNTDPWITSFFVGGRKERGIDTGVSTVFDFPLESTVRDVILQGASAKKIVNVLQHDSLYVHPYGLVTLIGNHDQKRFMGEPGATVEKLNAAMALLLTMRGVPQIYSGDEIAMPGGDDPDNRRDFPGGFPGDPKDAFTTAGRTTEEQAAFENTQALLKLRGEHPALRTGRQFHMGLGDTYYAFLREEGSDRVLVVLNSAPAEQTIKLKLGDTPLQNLRGVDVLYGKAKSNLAAGELSVTLPGMTVAVFRVR